jgi:hypothetical protein
MLCVRDARAGAYVHHDKLFVLTTADQVLVIWRKGNVAHSASSWEGRAIGIVARTACSSGIMFAELML